MGGTPSIRSLSAVLLVTATMAGCLTGEGPALPDQLRVRDPGLPGLTLYIDLTEDEEGVFHVRAVTVNEGEEAYQILRSIHAEDEDPCPRAPYTSSIQRANGQGGPIHVGLSRADACGGRGIDFKPGDTSTFEASWPTSDHPTTARPGFYIWDVGFRVSGDPDQRPDRVEARLVLEIPELSGEEEGGGNDMRSVER